MDNRNTNIQLTILIPTFNRKEYLSDTIDKLSRQSNQNFYLVISDNCSNYSIEEEILVNHADSFRERVSVFHRPYNIGGPQNIIGALAMTKTQWAWVLGDDDNILTNAVDTIYDRMNNDYALLWFSIDNRAKNIAISNLNELTEYIQNYSFSGDFIFCSNKVYNTLITDSYMCETYQRVYTCMSQCFPMIEALKNRKQIVIISQKIVEHGRENEITWNVNRVATGMRTLIDYNPGIQWKEYISLLQQIAIPFSLVLYSYLNSPTIPWNYRVYLKNLYNDMYRYLIPIQKRILIYPLICICSTRNGTIFIKRLYSYLKIIKRKIIRTK